MADPLSVVGGVNAITSLVPDTSFNIARYTKFLHQKRNEKPESVIVLSFRSLQAERIERLQLDLLSLMQRNEPPVAANDAVTEALSNREQTDGDAIDRDIDSKLHVYGANLQLVLFSAPLTSALSQCTPQLRNFLSRTCVRSVPKLKKCTCTRFHSTTKCQASWY